MNVQRVATEVNDPIEHPRYSDFFAANVAAEWLQAVLNIGHSPLVVNIHPFGFEQPDGANYELSVSVK